MATEAAGGIFRWCCRFEVAKIYARVGVECGKIIFYLHGMEARLRMAAGVRDFMTTAKVC